MHSPYVFVLGEGERGLSPFNLQELLLCNNLEITVKAFIISLCKK